MNNLSLNPSPGGRDFKSANTEVGNKNAKKNENETNSRIYSPLLPREREI